MATPVFGCNAAAPSDADGAAMQLLRHSLLVTTLVLAVPTDSLRPSKLEPMGDVAPPSAQPATSTPHDLRPLPAAVPDRETPKSKPALTTVEREVLEWAFGRFEAAGLDLPDVTIQFTADDTECNGEQGIYRRRDGEHSVTVCVPDQQGAAIEHRRRRTLLHELAHAWDHANLTDDDRNRILPILGSVDWYATDISWEHRGVERLAETLVWGLLDQTRRPLKIDASCNETHENFRSITGKHPLGPIEDSCIPQASRNGNAGFTVSTRW
jgi:hypothetical protein